MSDRRILVKFKKLNPHSSFVFLARGCLLNLFIMLSRNYDLFPNHKCCKPDGCMKCHVNDILFCKVCKRRMFTYESYNLHLTGKQHIKLVLRSGLPAPPPLEDGGDNFYYAWPPTPIDCSTPKPERVHRRALSNTVKEVITTDSTSTCNMCSEKIELDKYCFQVKQCGHKYHEDCNKKFKMNVVGNISCFNCKHYVF